MKGKIARNSSGSGGPVHGFHSSRFNGLGKRRIERFEDSEAWPREYDAHKGLNREPMNPEPDILGG